MRRRPSAAVMFSAIVIAVGSTQAQEPSQASLAEVARKAETAKATTRRATKIYTNASLSAVPTDDAPVAPAAGAIFESRSLGKSVSAEEMVARSEDKVEKDNAAQQSEPDWRNRAASLRKQLDDMRSRISALTVPNALTEANPTLKKSNDLDVANARRALDGLRKQWERLEVSASEAKIPSAWLDPRPQFQ
ncbi:MAG: hypothetical protein ABI039_06175 [Vicinamibacterales bacterium]